MEQIIPSIQYLRDLSIPFEVLYFPKSTEKGAVNVAKALGCKERQMIKTLLFQSDSKEAVLIMVGGDQNVISGCLKKAIGSRNIAMCAKEKVKEITGYEVGSIPPFHWQPSRFRSFIESSLMTETILGVGRGSWGTEIMISPSHLVKASQAIVVNLVNKEV